MNRQEVLRMANPLLFLAMVVQAVTAAFIFFRIKTPYTETILEIHEHNGMLLIALAAAHLALNWGWVKANYRRK